MMVGDSLTVGISDTMAEHGISVDDEAVGGRTAQEEVDTIGARVATDPKKLFIMFGINDFTSVGNTPENVVDIFQQYDHYRAGDIADDKDLHSEHTSNDKCDSRHMADN